MRDGAYLLVLPGEEHGLPVTLKNQTNPDGTVFQIVAGGNGVQLLSNLEPGYQLFPLLVITPARVSALVHATSVLSKRVRPSDKGEEADHVRTLIAIIMDVKDAIP